MATKEQIKIRIEKGLCTYCGINAPPVGKRICIACGKKWYQRYKVRYAEAEAQGKNPCQNCVYQKRMEGSKYCEKCRQINIKATYKKNQRLKLAAMNAYGGPKCSCCGESDMGFLTIDHINNDGAETRRKDKSAKKLYSWLKKHGYPPGHRVLCYNCNEGRDKAKDKICPHEKNKIAVYTLDEYAAKLDSPPAA